MKVDSMGYLATVNAGGELADGAERFGYDGWWAPETEADAFLSCAVAAQRTTTIGLGTGIAVAFARNPMTVALQANDLQVLSEGRFVLGLGSQIKPHIERRYSMPWSHPAPRMREFILAVRAIWRTWETDEKLGFNGDFYTHTLMTPAFSPGPNPYGNPKIILAAVGPKMTEVAGEVADGIFCHGFCTERYLRDVTLPALQRGAERAGKSLDGFEIIAPGFVVARDGEEEIAGGIEFVRMQIGFYGSTPAYRPVLDVHGWGELQQELNTLTKRGAWDELAGIIDDEVLQTFAVIGSPEEAAQGVRNRYGDVATRIALPVPDGSAADRWAPVFHALREPLPA
jgi:probable F420-dependent oxidoreductase